MTIVPIGKLVLQEDEGQEREEYLNELIEQMQEAVKTVVTRCIEAELEREVTQALKRKAHGRSKKVDINFQGRAKCRKCENQQVSQFWRNGHYWRGLDTSWGHLTIAMPQVRCRCGGVCSWNGRRSGQGNGSGMICAGRCKQNMVGA